MSDDFTILNPGVDGDVMDETAVTYASAPLVRKRPRVVITGNNLGEIVSALDNPPVGDEFGLVVRPIVSGYPGTLIHAFDTETAVISETETTIVTYTVPASKTFYFVGLSASGNTSAIFKLYVNSNIILAGRTSAANLNLDKTFHQSPVSVPALSSISIKVYHYTTVSCEFEATIFGHLI